MKLSMRMWKVCSHRRGEAKVTMEAAYLGAGASGFCHVPKPWLLVPNLSLSSRSAALRGLASAHMAGTSRIVEHVVLFKVKPDVPAQRAEALVSGLRSLKSLDVVMDLSAGPAFQASSGGYTHALHCRYKSKEALQTYANHPSHVDVVQKCVAPIVEDVLALDWEADLEESEVQSGYGAIRIAVMKSKDNVSEEELSSVLGTLKGCRDVCPLMKQVSLGKNFSPARAKGFDWGFLALFPSVQELREFTGHDEHKHLPYSKARSVMENFAIIDYSSV